MRRTEFLHNTRETGSMAFRTALPPGSKLSDFKPCADGQMAPSFRSIGLAVIRGRRFLREIWPKVKLALEYAWTMTPGKSARTPAAQGNGAMIPTGTRIGRSHGRGAAQHV